MAKASNSGKKAYVFSTLACDQRYVSYQLSPGGMATEEHSIFIKGGTGVANDRLITPIGVMTEISDEEVAILEANPVFKIHSDNGFVVIQRAKAEPEKVAGDMAMNDNSAPLTPADYVDVNGIQAPVTGIM